MSVHPSFFPWGTARENICRVHEKMERGYYCDRRRIEFDIYRFQFYFYLLRLYSMTRKCFKTCNKQERSVKVAFSTRIVNMIQLKTLPIQILYNLQFESSLHKQNFISLLSCFSDILCIHDKYVM